LVVKHKCLRRRLNEQSDFSFSFCSYSHD